MNAPPSTKEYSIISNGTNPLLKAKNGLFFYYKYIKELTDSQLKPLVDNLSPIEPNRSR